MCGSQAPTASSRSRSTPTSSAAPSRSCSVTLARRMWLASVTLAFIVVAAFAALIVAISAQREATAREARSRDVTAASFGSRSSCRHGDRHPRPDADERPRFLQPYTMALQTLPRATSRVAGTCRERPSAAPPGPAGRGEDPGVRRVRSTARRPREGDARDRQGPARCGGGEAADRRHPERVQMAS